MKRALIALLLSSPTMAAADAVSERVYLTTGASGCPTNQMGFRRVKQMPDGAATLDSTEFQVPSGWYLEITSIEWTPPHWTPWAQTYVQSADFRIVNRTGTPAHTFFQARYQNRPVFAWDGTNWDSIDEVSGPGAETKVAGFPVGPLMSSAARLCVSTSTNFWNYGGMVRVRGRLIPNNEIGASTSGTLP